MKLTTQDVCDVCLRNCRVARGKRGFCGIRGNVDGKIHAVEPFQVSEAAADQIEKKPIFHFQPGSRVYSVGAWGCTFHCGYCRNWEVACTRSAPADTALPSPEAFVQQVARQGCKGVAWTFSEPTLWHEVVSQYTEQCADANYYTLLLTNGAATRSIYGQLTSSGVGVWKIDLKGFSQNAYKTLTGFSDWRAVLDNIEWLRSYGGHVELSYCPIPGLCDSEDEVRALGEWVVSALGEDTPLHLLAFFPAFQMKERPFTDFAVLSRLRQLLRDEVGLHYVYVPLSLNPDERTTYCPSCGNALAERSVFGLTRSALDSDGCCQSCRSTTPIVLNNTFEGCEYAT